MKKIEAKQNHVWGEHKLPGKKTVKVGGAAAYGAKQSKGGKLDAPKGKASVKKVQGGAERAEGGKKRSGNVGITDALVEARRMKRLKKETVD